MSGANARGETFPVKVKAVYNQGRKPVYNWRFKMEDEVVSVDCTSNHKILCRASKSLFRRGELTVAPISEKLFYFKAVMRGGDFANRLGCDYAGEQQCWDIEVDHPDHLFVLGNGMIVSNSTKRGTAVGGDISKQAGAVAAKLIITAKDCGTSNGIDLAPDDESLRGRLLAAPALRRLVRAMRFSLGAPRRWRRVAACRRPGVGTRV